MKRREAQQARAEKREVRPLLESDYLLGVYNAHRMGALRFRLSDDTPFLDNQESQAAPPWTKLRDLEHASLQLERDDAENESDYLKWINGHPQKLQFWHRHFFETLRYSGEIYFTHVALSRFLRVPNMLIATGVSLGGARPKACVLDEAGHPWIAKFPSRHDKMNISKWEYLVYLLAQDAGIEVAQSKIQKFSGGHDTFLTKRFDRTESNERLHFTSARTLLGKKRG